MKISHIALFAVLLLVNNLALLWFMGYFSDRGSGQPAASTVISAEAGSASKQALIDSNQSQRVNAGSNTESASSNGINTLSAGDQSTTADEQQKINNAVRNFITSSEFMVVLDQVQLASVDRYTKIQKDLAGMDALELYEAVANSEDLYKKQIALQYLMQGRLDDLDLTDIETLYRDHSTNNYTKSKLLTHLVDRNAPGALNWAKELVSGPIAEEPYFYNTEIFESIYQRDEEFIESMISKLDLSKSNVNNSLVTFALLDPHLREKFVETHLDSILEYGSNEVLKLASHQVDTKLDRSQQLKLQTMFGSGNRHQRAFAISMVGNVEDTDQIRGYFQELEHPADQRKFLTQILAHQHIKNTRRMAHQLAATSDDPEIRAMFEIGSE